MRKDKSRKLTKKNITINEIVLQCIGIMIETLFNSKNEKLDTKIEFNFKKNRYNVDLSIHKVKKVKKA